MKRPLMTAALAFAVGCGLSPTWATGENDGARAQEQEPATGRSHLFEERAGTWKATCDEMETGKVYCRLFHIEQFGEWKTRNFVQLGPAWTPESVGFVVATYLGFKEGTTVSIGIDRHGRHVLTAPKGNNLTVSPEVAENILREMETGHRIVVDFHSYSGVRHLSLADLEPYNRLLAKVRTQLAKNGRPGSADE